MANAHYVDNKKLYQAIVEYRKVIKECEQNGKERPPIPRYVGECMLLIAKRLSTKPNFVNYPYREEMISDGIENCVCYFDNYNPDRYDNPFAYFTQIIYYAFHRRINKEEKNRYIMYKKFQESFIETGNVDRLLDVDGNNLITPMMYDNLNQFIGNFEAREAEKKKKRKLAKEGLEKFVGEDDEGRESV